MPDALLASRSTVGPPSLVPATFACALRDGGLDAAWVRVTGELGLAVAPRLVLARQDRGA